MALMMVWYSEDDGGEGSDLATMAAPLVAPRIAVMMVEILAAY